VTHHPWIPLAAGRAEAVLRDGSISLFPTPPEGMMTLLVESASRTTSSATDLAKAVEVA
jgi:hypothetical protein